MSIGKWETNVEIRVLQGNRRCCSRTRARQGHHLPRGRTDPQAVCSFPSPQRSCWSNSSGQGFRCRPRCVLLDFELEGLCGLHRVLTFFPHLGRWPVKSAKFLLGLLKNAQSNAEVNGLDINELEGTLCILWRAQRFSFTNFNPIAVSNLIVQQAPKTRRRTYRAHGRINPYQGHPTHIEVILTPIGAEIPRASEEIVGGKKEAKVAEIEA